MKKSRKNNKFNDLMALVETLSANDKKMLVGKIMKMMQNPYEEDRGNNLKCNKLVKEHIDAEKPDCPHCKAKANLGCIIKRGFRNGSQCYYCKSCGRRFMATTGTAFEKTRKNSDTWTKFIELTISGASIKKCAEECELCIQTAFTWRHKILNTFRLHQQSANFSGQIELDEMLLPISYKGNHVQGSPFNKRRLNEEKDNSNMPRQSYKRGTDNICKSSKGKACVFCMVKNGNEGFYATVPGVGFMNDVMLSATVGKHVKKEGTLVLADQYKVTARYLNTNNYNYMLLASNTTNVLHEHKPEIQDDKHLQHVNAMHMHIRRFLRNYCGVSTKYLENYLSLFVWLKNVAARKQSKHTQKVSISRLAANDCYISRKGLEAFPAVPDCVEGGGSENSVPNWAVYEEIPF